MSRRRFHAPPESFAPDGARVTLSREETQHLRGVLRLRPGDEAYVFDGAGNEYLCVVEDAGRRPRDEAVLVVRGAVAPPHAESPLELTLAVALLKHEKFDLVVQKATELGVTRIVPVEAARADVRLRGPEEAGARLVRWRRLALEAAKQCGRARVPAVEPPAALDAFLSDTGRGDETLRRVLFAERGGRGLTETARDWPARPRRVAALVGPEGGWDEEEVEQAREAGWQIVTLGGRTLRAETAAVVVAGLLQHLCGDLR